MTSVPTERGIASFHLVAHDMPGALLALPRLATDRRGLRRVRGLRFWRLLGTGRGSATGPGADLTRTACFAVWEDPAALDAFLTEHPIARRWTASGSWGAELAASGGHGSWRGFDPLGAIRNVPSSGPIAVITRADVRRGAWRSFGAASREVDAELHSAPGLIDVVGIGEAPVGRLGTFSLWDSAASARHYATTSPRHRTVIAETRQGRWYTEELFARFTPLRSWGSWDGRDPLAGLLAAAPDTVR